MNFCIITLFTSHQQSFSLAQGHSAVTTARFESEATRSRGLSRTEARGQGHSDPAVVIDISRPNMYPHTLYQGGICTKGLILAPSGAQI